MSDDDLRKLLRRLGVYQARIEAEMAKGDKADLDKIAKAYAAGQGLRYGCSALLPFNPADQPASGWRRNDKGARWLRY